jgi:hypothetical protein
MRGGIEAKLYAKRGAEVKVRHQTEERDAGRFIGG